MSQFSPQTVALVKATVPLLRQQGEAITRHFYALMFRDHPEVKAFFNEAHQAEGSQARALAGAVLAYATNIDRLEVIAPALPRIVQKHAALGVLPEHYPVVGASLLKAIREVLGEIASDEVIAAWAEAYGALAQLLIDAEEQVYAANAARAGGWRGRRTMKLARKVIESELITSFYLEPSDGQPLVSFTPGQYLTLLLKIDGQVVRRNYSLSDAPGKPWYRISVKREASGKASIWLHDEFAVGMELQAQAPCGDFLLDANAKRPLVLVTGGVGITPAMSMLEASAGGGRAIHFIHAAKHGGIHAFRDRVESLAIAHPNIRPFFIYDEPREIDRPHAVGFITEELLAKQLPADRDVDLYFLGPKPFMKSVYAIGRVLGIADAQLRYEFFGPLEPLGEYLENEQGAY